VGAPLGVLVGESVPHPVPGHGAAPAVRVQVTPLLLASFATVAANNWGRLTATLGLVGTMLTVISDAGVIVIVAVAVLVTSATEVAVMVTVAGVGTVAGAV